jgi:hypothetical protein
MTQPIRLLLALSVAACALCAAETRIWSQSEYADFEKGDRKKVSLSSDGHLRLAPLFQEIFDSSSVYLWALAEDSKGNLYAGGGGPGGPGARIYLLPRNGKGKVLAQFDNLEVHAIAIDRQDRVYAATAPDGKVYRVSPAGKSEVFFDPKAKYIWGMVFDSHGNLFIATGDRGEIYQVTPGGQGKVFYKTPETHVRSLAIDSKDNLIAGTEPGGLIIRVTPAGEGFVLYQAAKREITAVAVAADGSIYAAGVGNKAPYAGPGFVHAPSPAPTTPAQAMQPAPPAPPAPGEQAAQQPAQKPPTAPAPPVAAPIAGGSEVYRIDKDGSPTRVWSHPVSIVYAIGFDSEGRPLIGTGNKGLIYRLDSRLVYTELVNAPPTQITALHADRSGKVFAATGNVGKVYQIGPGVEKQGTMESDVLDAGLFSHWGRLSFQGREDGGRIALETRSGNLDRPQNDWSPWSAAITSPDGARVTSPPARFLQWRAVIDASAAGASPELHQVDVAYLQKNVAPEVQRIDITPPNYRFPPQVQLTISPNPPLTLPPMGRPARKAPPALSVDLSSISMQYAKGWIGARWAALDENGDDLSFTVEIRGEGEQDWKPLKDKVTDKHLSWDSTSFPDGKYRVRVIASDVPDNPPGQALTGELASDSFTIDNTPPVVSGLIASAAGNKITVRWHAADALNIIDHAEYSVNGSDWTMVDPTTKLSDSKEEDYVLTLDRPSPSEQTIAVRATDDYDNTAVAKVVVK